MLSDTLNLVDPSAVLQYSGSSLSLQSRSSNFGTLSSNRNTYPYHIFSCPREQDLFPQLRVNKQTCLLGCIVWWFDEKHYWRDSSVSGKWIYLCLVKESQYKMVCLERSACPLILTSKLDIYCWRFRSINAALFLHFNCWRFPKVEQWLYLAHHIQQIE